MTPTPHGVRAVLLIPVLALVAATVACAAASPAATSATSPAAGQSAAVTPSASGAATPTATTVATPAQAFGGQCAALLTDAAVAADLGAPVTPFTADHWGPSDYASSAIGGVNCYWQGPKAKDQQFLDLVVLPSAAISKPVTKPLDCSSEEGFTECYFNAFAEGYWFSGRASGKTNASLASVKAGTQKLVGQLDAAAGTAGTPATGTVFPGRWAKPTSCKALGTLAGVVAASGSPTLKPTPLDSEPDGPDGYYSALAASPYLGCAWATTGTVAKGKLDGFTIELAPGGAWAKSLAVTSSYVAVTVPGTDSAFTEPDGNGIDSLVVFKGSNWATFGTYGGPITLAQIAPVATAVVGALG